VPIPNHELLDRYNIRHPVFQGPMGGGPSTPELVAAVSNAGGLGSLGAAYMTPEGIIDGVRRIKQLTDKPFNVNLFAGGWTRDAAADAGPMLDVLAEIHAELKLPPPVLPTVPPDPFSAQLEAVLDAGVPIFSFTFGIPNKDDMLRLKKNGTAIWGTATTAEEARLLAEAGADAVVAQGAEAGAHRGTFAGSFESSMIPTLRLVREICGSCVLPVIAAGGLMDGGDIMAALQVGASAAAMGTAFLPCPECGTSVTHKQAVLHAEKDTTVITRAFSGRPARGLRNEFIERLMGKEKMILPYPLQNALTRIMRSEAAQQGVGRFLSLWAGTGVARARKLPAGELVRQFVEEMNAAQ
jgi:nitronate monooxygenase